MPILDRCANCGRIIGFQNYVGYALYGRVTDIDPPDIEFECLKCWDEEGEEGRKLTYKVSWIKPVVVRDGKRESYIPKEADETT